MKLGTRVRVKECKAALPALHGVTGEVYYSVLDDLIVMLKLDKPVFDAPSFYGGYFHTISIKALEVIEQ